MSSLGEILPVTVFFIAYQMSNLFTATLSALITSAVFIIFQKVKHRKLSNSQIFSFLAILVFGGLTLFLQDERFIKWKTSIVYWGFAVACLVSHWTPKTLMQLLMGNKLHLPLSVWKKLNFAWGGFFFGMGSLNWIAMQFLTTRAWVNYKFFGTFILTVSFVLIQSLFLSRYLSDSKN